MKVCPYCGKKYPEDALTCAIDGESLVGGAPQPLPAIKSLGNQDQQLTRATFPEYRWSAVDAWKCLGVIMALQFSLRMLSLALEIHIPAFARWYASGAGNSCWYLFHFCIYLLVAAFFARTETLESFWNGFGLNRKPSEYVWWGIVAALVLRFFGHVVLGHGWSHGVTNYDLHAFKTTDGPDRYFYLMPLLFIAPLFEETIFRGFVYKAFRRSYSIQISIVLIVAWTANTHWNQYSHSVIAVFGLSLLTIVQCYLREKSASLWDCILCHITFNGSTFLFGDAFR